MTGYGYDENLPYVVEGRISREVHARFRDADSASRYVAGVTSMRVIDTTPKPRVPEDAKFITWFDQGRRVDRMAVRLGTDFWNFGGGRDYLDNLPGVTPDTVFTVLDARDERRES